MFYSILSDDCIHHTHTQVWRVILALSTKVLTCTNCLKQGALIIPNDDLGISHFFHDAIAINKVRRNRYHGETLQGCEEKQLY
mmetsp:Transcript_17198/g.25607  ORF Transcript_17198/g.25607 Transcript_17198/m.25607 type:complete len:83 (+) Transcript_17198:534-782(+)